MITTIQNEIKTNENKRYRMLKQNVAPKILDCPCGSKITHKALHEKSSKHKNYIEHGIIFRPTTPAERSRRTYFRLREIFFTCECGKNVRESSRYIHNRTDEHKYFITHGHAKPSGNQLTECECGAEVLCYNMRKHVKSNKHMSWLERQQYDNEETIMERHEANTNQLIAC